MFGIGTSEFFVIIIVAVLVLGPEHLPRIMRTINKVMSDFRKISTDFQRTINLETYTEEQKPTSTPKKKKKKKSVKQNPQEIIETPNSADELATESQEKAARKDLQSTHCEKTKKQKFAYNVSDVSTALGHEEKASSVPTSQHQERTNTETVGDQ